MKSIYTVVYGEDHCGIQEFNLFDSEEKAKAYAKGLREDFGRYEKDWEKEELEDEIESWRMGCDYLSIIRKEVK